MRTPSSLLSLVSVGAMALLVAIVVSQLPPLVSNERVEAERPEEYTDAVLQPSSVDSDPKTEARHLHSQQDDSIRSLIGVSIEREKRPAPIDDAANDAFRAALSGSNVKELLRLAKEEHHAEAARVLYQKQRDCQTSPATLEEHERQKEVLIQSRTIDYSSEAGAQMASDEELRLYLDIWQNTFNMCTVLRPMLEGDDTDYMKLAADNGSTGAMMDYANSILGSEPDLARSYFYGAWEAGASDALRLLSNYERERFERGEDPSADVESVAFSLAYAAVQEATIEIIELAPSHPVSKALTKRVDTARDRLNALVQYKRDLALARARELIDANSRCCILLGS